MPNVDYLTETRRVVHEVLRGYKVTVYLFGSWAKGTAQRRSDIDLAVDAKRPLPPGLLAHLREQLEESHIPYRVEVVDLTSADPAFRTAVISHGIRWND